MKHLTNLLLEIWHVFNEASIYILFGLFLAGLIHAFIKKDKIARHLGKNNFQSVLKAALIGIPLPLCSCGVIPTAMGLRKSGASKGSTLSFLISTPESGIDSLALSFALLDPIMAIFRPIAAFFTAITAGVSENIFGLDKDKHVKESEQSCSSCPDDEVINDEHHHSFKQKFQSGMKFAFWDLLGDIGKWFAIGITIAGVISFFVPDSLISNYLSSGWQAMFLMLLMGIPMYVCASASTPIAAALILKGMSPGVALVFLLVGPATNTATILVIGKALGKRSAIIYVLSIAICAVLLGLLLNQIYFMASIDIQTTLGKAGEVIPHSLKIVSSVILLILLANVWRHAFKKKMA